MKNVIMILLDGARYEFFKEMPFFKEISKEGTLFSNAITPAPYTIGAMHSVFSGTYGYKTGVNSYYAAKKFNYNKFQSITQIFQEKGYYTRGDLLNDMVIPLKGFDKCNLHDEVKDNLILNHKEIISSLPKEKPFFLYLHYSNIHTVILEPVLKKYSNLDKKYFEEKEENKGRYNQALIKTDNYLQQIIQELKKQNLYEDTIIVVFSDHGCSIGDRYGERAYGAFCYDYTVKTFSLFLNNELFAKKEISQMSRLIDIFPTILEATKTPIPKNIDGKSLFSLIKNPEEKRLAYIETGCPPNGKAPPKEPNIKAIRTEEYKFIKNYLKNTEELYNLKEDPNEKNNLIDKEDSKKFKELFNIFQKDSLKF